MDYCHVCSRWTYGVLSALVLSLFFFIHPAYAEFPPAPVLDGLPEQVISSRDSKGPHLGRVVLRVGDVRLLSFKKIYPIPEAGVVVAPGDTLISGPTGRFRLLLEGGDLLHVGENSLIALDQNAEKSLTVTMWQGTLISYTFPSLGGRKSTQTVRLPYGVAKLTTGKTGILLQPSESFSHISAFKGALTWLDNQGNEHKLSQGRSVYLDSEGFKEAFLVRGSEKRWTMQVSPEGPLVATGLRLYESKKYKRSIAVLKRVQKAFPYNSLAAYYLGLSYLGRQALGPATSQLKRYEKIDPKGARKNNVSQNLTVLLSKRMKEEVREVLASEQRINQSKPTPNSMAVSPFTNKGQPKFDVMAKGITAMIIADISKVPGIKVLERAKMQKLVDEIKLSQSGLVSEDTQIRAGRLLKAEKLVIGDYTVK